MGNDNNHILAFPAAYPGVIAVGAITLLGERWVQSSTVGSNTGLHISVAAPGEDIWSTDLFASFGSPQYTVASGTSVAAPFVAGVAALIYACNRQLKPSQVKKINEQTANKTVPVVGLPFPNPVYGNGIVDARAAVDCALDGPIPPA
jgi:subtilisin family serine protease